ncbi:GntR family transcriptional regulator [Streptomyces sp. NPDC020917]|uniref:GntR family transcriptional regulator n=1 Tax=Streptomyces sp. NPDC020917 TaxID=3365102 RepID=UPI0037BDD1CF
MTSEGTFPIGTPVLGSLRRNRVRQRTSDRVYDELAGAIRDLRIPPGASLSETDLAEQLQVSRTPLREALARLVDAGLVSVVPNVGTRVELIRLNDVERARFVRESLEIGAFTTACESPERDVSALRELLDRQTRACEAHDLSAFFAADEALHELIFALSGHPDAWHLMQPLKMHLDRMRWLSLPEQSTVRSLIAEHTAIVDALEAGDVEGGRTHLRSHARRALEKAPSLQARYPEYFDEHH